ncbi:acyltransferase family protein [Terriglobus aquaticus]|uniref:Acyltransferase family protein n=1 Tax=Terriglobus aquaticus TaxID=940139 RepID=A0ABW9KNA7_9BACT|nr:acyltransferase [Terriglobus aquaticus]
MPNESSKAQIRALTGLRGIAAAFVVVYHFLSTHHFSHNPANNILQHGYLTVDLFFVLSGFVMALNYGKLFAQGFSRHAYAGFLWRRIARVYPLYLVMTVTAFIIFSTGLVVFRPEHPLWRLLISNLLMVQAWGVDWSLDFPGWSISTEWAAYLLFPVLFAVTMKRRWGAAIAAGCASLAALGALCLYVGPLAPREPANALLNLWFYFDGLPVVRCLAGFTLGILTFRVFGTGWGQRFARHQVTAVTLILVLLAMLVVPKTDFAIVALFPLLILSLAADATAPARALTSRPLYFLGEISYSVYLVHGLIAPWVIDLAAYLPSHHVGHPRLVAAAFGIAATSLVSVAAYRWIEVPGRRWGRKFFEPARANRASDQRRELRAEPSGL